MTAPAARAARAYYNENDSFAVAWLRELIRRNLIAPGDVDDRSIADVQPADLVGYTQCHFFAGIGGWSYALRLAYWPDDRPVWTGSCPCQPFSTAGRQAGTADRRHLWPEWFRLIAQCRPDVIFGEQVEAAIRHGWLDIVQTDLEGEDYAVGAVGLLSAGVGAFDIRQRLWFVADRDSSRFGSRWTGETGDGRDASRIEPAGLRDAGGVADAECGTAERRRYDVAAAPRDSESATQERERLWDDAGNGSVLNFWSACDWLPCTDGKSRPVEPGTFPLAHGLPARVGRLRGYGNAINPYVAKEVIVAYCDTRR